MKIKRFVAKDMRSALEQIKFELGADAVIMSNKKIPEGVELMAAVDNHQAIDNSPSTLTDTVADRDVGHDRVTLRSHQQANRQEQQPTSGANTITSHLQDKINSGAEAPADSLSALLNRKVQSQADLAQAAKQQVQATHNSHAELPIEEQFKNFTQRLETNQIEQATSVSNEISPEVNINHQAQTATTESAEILRMRDEMASIRQLLEHQVAGLLWQDMAQKNPNRAVLVSRLQNMGIAEQLADQFAGYISANASDKDAWQQVNDILIEQLNTTNNDIIRHGGVVSLVGPTGVGKTTTIAKLAARFAQTHGADSVALISTDTYRIAGFEQLTTYARIIGCQAKLAKDHLELDDLIQHFSGKKLVLIDTAGMGQRDMRLSQYLSALISNARVRIRNYLVLSANTQQRVMQENVERFKKIPLAGCIFTKLDESLSVGEIISTSIQNGLPIGYLTDGQRVPEDIKVANAEKLVRLADKMATKYATTHASTLNSMTMSSTACA